MVADGQTLVIAAEESTALKFRHDLVDEIVEPARNIGKHDVEPVTSAILQPRLHLIGDD